MTTWKFIALWPADADAPALAAAAAELARIGPGVRAERAERLHLTLAFLGACGGRDMVVAAQACADAAMAAGGDLVVRLDQVGAFGGGRVLAAEPDEGSAGLLMHVHEVARGRLAHGGVSLEDRPFRPHVSLARLPGSGLAHVGGLSPQALPRVVRFDRIALVSSAPVEGGRRSWRVCEQWALGSGGGRRR